jgi:hypothetical protein
VLAEYNMKCLLNAGRTIQTIVPAIEKIWQKSKTMHALYIEDGRSVAAPLARPPMDQKVVGRYHVDHDHQSFIKCGLPVVVAV